MLIVPTKLMGEWLGCCLIVFLDSIVGYHAYLNFNFVT